MQKPPWSGEAEEPAQPEDQEVQEALDAKNGPEGFHYELFFMLGWKPYIYVSPPLQC
jgi:hypothetical protein